LDSPTHIPALITQEVHVEDALPAGGKDLDRRAAVCAREDAAITGWASGQRRLQDSAPAHGQQVVDMPEESHSQRQSTPEANADIVLT
jgi:hypothetical protein